jgi:hypothetical protein
MMFSHGFVEKGRGGKTDKDGMRKRGRGGRKNEKEERI